MVAGRDEAAGVDDGFQALDFVLEGLSAFGDGTFVDAAAVGHFVAVDLAISGEVVSGGDFLGAVGVEAGVDPGGEELADVAVGVDFEDGDACGAGLIGPLAPAGEEEAAAHVGGRPWAFPCRPCLHR